MICNCSLQHRPSKWWVVCPFYPSGHCGLLFPADQGCLFLKPSTFLFIIKTCFVSAPHMDGLRARGWLVSIEVWMLVSNLGTTSAHPAVWACTLGLSSLLVELCSVPEILYSLLMHSKNLVLCLTWLGILCFAASVKSKPNFVKDKIGGRKEEEGGIVL